MYNACVLYKYMYKSRVHVQLKEFLYFKLYEIILITYVLAFPTKRNSIQENISNMIDIFLYEILKK